MAWKSNSHDIETDNDRLDLKLKIRNKALNETNLNTVSVLDVFAGENLIWDKLGYDKYQGIEIEKGKGKNNIYGDNINILPTLNLSAYNVIDLDSYGIPFPQAEIILNSKLIKKGTIVMYTAISNSISNLNKSCVKYYGLEDIYSQNRSMLNGYGLNMFYGMLFDKGITKVHEYSIETTFKKKYGYFVF